VTSTANNASNGEETAGRDPRDSASVLQRLGEGVSVWDLEVTRAWAITPTMRRLRCTSPGLAALSHLPGQDLMLAVPAPDGQFVRRRYTVRSNDAANATIDIDVVLHGDGPGATWAAAAQPGAHVEAIGPRGKVTVDPSADWHLFAGDDSAIPDQPGHGRIPGHPSARRGGT
jgi:NADPH-dependent ferric siderophore reductase